jgi:hypothetical protein
MPRPRGRPFRDDADALGRIDELIAQGVARWAAVASVVASIAAPGDRATAAHRLRRKLRARMISELCPRTDLKIHQTHEIL